MNGIETVRRYFDMAESFTSDAATLQEVLHPDITITEFPNALSPHMRTHQFSEMQAGLAAGGKLLAWQRFEIRNSFQCENTLVVEVGWKGEMGIDAGKLMNGQVLTAHICFLFEFQDGKIIRHRNYDCYDAF